MTSPPSSHAIEALLALCDSCDHRHGWIRLDHGQLAARLHTGAGRVRELIAELTVSGLCIPAAHGDLVYLSVEGIRLAEAARQLVRSGTASVGPVVPHAATGPTRS